MKLTEVKLKALILEAMEDEEFREETIIKIKDQLTTGDLEDIRSALALAENAMLDEAAIIELKEAAIEALKRNPIKENVFYLLELAEELGRDPETETYNILRWMLMSGNRQFIKDGALIFGELHQSRLWATSMFYQIYFIGENEEILKKLMHQFPNLNWTKPPIQGMSLTAKWIHPNFLGWDAPTKTLNGKPYAIMELQR